MGANENCLLNVYRVYFFKWWKYSKSDQVIVVNILKMTELLKREENIEIIEIFYTPVACNVWTLFMAWFKQNIKLKIQEKNMFQL